jgi:hypothetical protein
MLFDLIEHLNEWLMVGMPLQLPLNSQQVESAEATVPLLLGKQMVMGVSTPKHFNVISNRNVYHPRKREMLLLRAGQTVTLNLVEKLCQFGIDVATFCSLKEQHTGKIYPITEETIAWLPDNQSAIKIAITKQSIKEVTSRSSFLGLPLTPSTHSLGVPTPTNGRRFDATLSTLKSCPLPNLLVLHPSPEQNKKLHKQLAAIGVEYQQRHPVLSDEAFAYSLKKYQPQVLIIDEDWLLATHNRVVETIATTVEQQLEVATELLVSSIKMVQQKTPTLLSIIVLISPSVTQRAAIVQALSRLNQLASVKVLWKPYKRNQLKEGLEEFIQTTQTQLHRRQEDPTLMQYS